MQLSRLGPALVMFGVLLMFAGAALSFNLQPAGSQFTYGGVVFLGPFPIVFGAGPGYPFLLVVEIVIVIAMVLFLIYYSLLARRRSAQQDLTV